MARHEQAISRAIGIPRHVAAQILDEGLTLSCQMFLRNYLNFMIAKNGGALHHESVGLGRACCRVCSRLSYRTETGINIHKVTGFRYSGTYKPSTAHFFIRCTTNMGPCPATFTLHTSMQEQ